MKEFGKKAYVNTVYINFKNNSIMSDLFSYDLDVHRLVKGIEVYTDQIIDPDNTLLIFDELQEVPRALTSLKYFNENAPEYHIVCTCSFNISSIKEHNTSQSNLGISLLFSSIISL